MSRLTTLQRILPLAVGLALAASGASPLNVAAQTAPASSASSGSTVHDMSSMDMGSMDMGGMPMPASSASTAAPAAASTTQTAHGGGMTGMQRGATSGMDRGTSPAPKPAASAGSPARATSTMDMGGMDMGGMPMPASSTGNATPATAGSSHAEHGDGMAGMKPGTMSGMDQPQNDRGKTGQASSSKPRMSGMSGRGKEASGAGASGMSMGAMQGGSAPANARSSDYSDGVGYGHMPGMDMTPPKVERLLLEELDSVHGREGNGQAWKLQGWYGGDINKLWLRSEGDRSGGRVQDGSAEVLWNHLFATYWSTQFGVRRDIGVGPGRTWAAFGVEGLAPYFFDVEATAYVGQSGRTAARFNVSYDVLFTQRVILTPEFELNAYGKADPARRLGAGVSDASLGLRLRYEIRRQFAPYIGVNWVRRFGATAGYARRDRQPVFDPQIVAGLRIWF